MSDERKNEEKIQFEVFEEWIPFLSFDEMAVLNGCINYKEAGCSVEEFQQMIGVEREKFKKAFSNLKAFHLIEDTPKSVMSEVVFVASPPHPQDRTFKLSYWGEIERNRRLSTVSRLRRTIEYRKKNTPGAQGAIIDCNLIKLNLDDKFVVCCVVCCMFSLVCLLSFNNQQGTNGKGGPTKPLPKSKKTLEETKAQLRDEYNILPVSERKCIHLVVHFCKLYFERYNTIHELVLGSDQNVFTSKDLADISKVYNMLGKDSTLTSQFLEWVFGIKEKDLHGRTIGTGLLPYLVDDFKLHSKKGTVPLSNSVPISKWLEIREKEQL